MSFYFPYNFYPVTGEVKQGETTHKPRYTFDYQANSTNKTDTAHLARHDVWVKQTYSGYFDIKITTFTPTLVGNTHKKLRPHDDNSPSIVTPYYWNDQLALPGNSIRGMIASIAETLSQSTLRVLDKKYHPAFTNTDPDLTPWKNGRSELTPAEMLFGVVDTDGSDSGDTQNLASRVHFTDAILQGNNEQALTDEIPLKELASSKADGVLPPIGNKPSSLNAYNHYFQHRENNQPATHRDVLNGSMEALKPLGRKFYLKRRNLKEQHYKGADGAPRSMKGKFIKEAQIFNTKIHFNNLSEAELTLLKTSIQPSVQYVHQIGLGKALGLGAIRITDIELQTIDRTQRYANKPLKQTSGKKAHSINSLKDSTLIDNDTLKILQTAGNISNLEDAEDIHWRDGRNDSTRPVPTLHANQTSLPLAEEIKNENTLVIEEDLQTETDNDLAESDTEAAQWLKSTIGQLNNNTNYKDLTHDNIVTIIKGKALSKKWNDIPEAEAKKKEAILKLIHQQIEQREIQRYDLASVAEKRYFK